MPSVKILEKKQAQAAELTEKLKRAQAGVLVNYSGITVEQDTALRKSLREAGVEYRVYKNTMTGRACKEAGYEGMTAYLEGMNAIAFSESDPIAPARILCEFAEKNEKLQVRAGFVDGSVLDEAGVKSLAATPSKEVMVCKIMGCLKSSLFGLAYVLQAKIDKDNAGTEEAAE